MTTTEIHTHLQDLQAERALATLEGLASDPAYMAFLAGEIAVTGNAYVGAAVTEIATLRGQLSGPLAG
jgi:hypothetical protein